MSQFSFKSVLNFDNHISNSISNYDYLHKLILNISSFFLQEEGICYDLGASTGKLVDELIRLNPNCKVIGFEKELNIVKSNNVVNSDITHSDFLVNENNVSLILSVFTIQFLRIKDRQDLLNKIYKSLHTEGAFIIAEKIYIQDGLIQEVFTFTNYDYKRQNFSAKEILEKEKSLRSIMKPLTEESNLSMLEKAGFKKIEKFYQSLNFCAWIAIK